MKKKETRPQVKAALYGLGAVVWIADCAGAVSHGRPGLGFLLFLAAAVFIAVFIVTLRRYLNSRTEENRE